MRLEQVSQFALLYCSWSSSISALNHLATFLSRLIAKTKPGLVTKTVNIYKTKSQSIDVFVLHSQQ